MRQPWLLRVGLFVGFPRPQVRRGVTTYELETFINSLAALELGPHNITVNVLGQGFMLEDDSDGGPYGQARGMCSCARMPETCVVLIISLQGTRSTTKSSRTCKGVASPVCRISINVSV